MIRVLVADDHPIVRGGIVALLSAADDMTVVGEASDGLEAVRLAAEHTPDVVLMDLRMPGVNGIEATKLLLARGRADEPPRVIVLTTLRQDGVVVQALAAGASAFLTKDATPDQVLGTIRATQEGAVVPDLAATLALVADLRGASSGPARGAALEPLSPREREVFLLVARGLTNAEIAEAEYVSEATVKSHIAAILRKLGLRSRVQVVVFAHQNGLVSV